MLIRYPMWLQRIIKLLLNFKLEWNRCQYLPLLIDKYGKIWNFISMNFCIIKKATCTISSSAMYINIFTMLCGLDNFLDAYKIYLQYINKSFMKMTYLQVYSLLSLVYQMPKYVVNSHPNAPSCPINI